MSGASSHKYSLGPPKEGSVAQLTSCDVCGVTCGSQVNLQQHLLGNKHKARANALGMEKSGSTDPVGPGKVEDPVKKAAFSAQLGTPKVLERRRFTEPAIGLQFVLQWHIRGVVCYMCLLCKCRANLKDMRKHVVGAKHRLLYLRKKHPEMVTGRCSTSGSRLRRLAAEVEERDRIKKMLAQEREDAAEPTKHQTSSKRPRRSRDPPPPGPLYSEALKIQDLDKIVDGFGTKKEFLEYLGQFQIRCEDDAAFVRRVTQHFTQSLVKYREKVKVEAATAAPPVTSLPHQPGQQVAGPPTSVYSAGPPPVMPAYSAGPPPFMPAYSAGPPPFMPAYSAGPPPLIPAYSAGPPPLIPAYSAGPPPLIPPYSAGPPPVIPANTMATPGNPGPLQGTNNATIEFLTNIKNLNAEEMSAILYKVAATKPGFKDMDIPNVIRTLRERGNLKPSNKGSSQY